MFRGHLNSLSLGMEFVKHVALPIRQVAPRRTIRGFKEDFGHLTEDVVLLAGEIHLNRKPVSIQEPLHSPPLLTDYGGIGDTG
jgi:hypothetical protein